MLYRATGQEKGRILLIEDEKDLADTIGNLFSCMDYSVQVCHSCKDASFPVMNEKYDCILSDLRVEVRDAAANLFEKIRSNQMGRNYRTPIIVLSAFIDHDFMSKYGEKIQGAFVKPCDYDLVLKKIEALMSIKSVA